MAPGRSSTISVKLALRRQANRNPAWQCVLSQNCHCSVIASMPRVPSMKKTHRGMGWAAQTIQFRFREDVAQIGSISKQISIGRSPLYGEADSPFIGRFSGGSITLYRAFGQPGTPRASLGILGAPNPLIFLVKIDCGFDGHKAGRRPRSRSTTGSILDDLNHIYRYGLQIAGSDPPGDRWGSSPIRGISLGKSVRLRNSYSSTASRSSRTNTHDNIHHYGTTPGTDSRQRHAEISAK